MMSCEYSAAVTGVSWSTPTVSDLNDVAVLVCVLL